MAPVNRSRRLGRRLGRRRSRRRCAGRRRVGLGGVASARQECRDVHGRGDGGRGARLRRLWRLGGLAAL
eukprot:323181-Prymnesium_polylepis.1